MEWTKTETLKFIELLQGCPSLWNKSLNDYKNKSKRRNALSHLAEQLNVNINAVEKKILSLKTQYNREIHKIKAKSESGLDDMPHSNWYAFEHLHFLKDINYVPRHSTDSLLVTLKENDEEEVVFDDNKLECNLHNNIEQSFQQFQPRSLKRKSDSQTGIHDPLNDSSDEYKYKPDKDDFMIFGESISSELREIKSKKHLLILKKDLMNLIYNTKLKILEEEYLDN